MTFTSAPTAPVLAQATWRALGTTVHLLVTDPGRLELARRAVIAVLADVDATYSRFRKDSELAVLVADAGRDHLVSPLMARAMGTALHAARATDGAVDPTIGRALRLLGYDDDFARLPRGGPAGPGDRPAGNGAVAHCDGRGRHLCRRQCRRNGGHRDGQDSRTVDVPPGAASKPPAPASCAPGPASAPVDSGPARTSSP